MADDERVNVGLRTNVTESEFAELTTVSKTERRSVANVIRMAIQEYLDRRREDEVVEE